MNKRERLHAAIHGLPVDRVPVSAWGHFFLEESEPESFVAATMRFQKRYDWDFIKIHPRASYCAEGFGFRYRPSEDAAKAHATLVRPINRPGDWRMLRPVPLSDPVLQGQLEVVRRLRSLAGPDVPLIMTVFSPLDVAHKLADRDTALLEQSMQDVPDTVQHALGVIAETFAPFVRALTREGIDGIFFSTKWVNAGKLSGSDYDRIAGAHDRAVLAEASGLACNIMHLCEDGVDVAALSDYPVQIRHWDDEAPNNPSLKDGQELSGKTVAGGVSVRTLAQGSPADIRRLVDNAIEATGGRRLVIGPGCTIHMARTPPANLEALRAAV